MVILYQVHYGVDITNFFGGEGEIMTNIFDSTGFTVAPELTSVGTLCSIAIVALVKFYSSKNVGLIVLDPSATKVMIATHNMLGNLVPREVSVNSFIKSPHASSQYHLFKIEDDTISLKLEFSPRKITFVSIKTFLGKFFSFLRIFKPSNIL